MKRVQLVIFALLAAASISAGQTPQAQPSKPGTQPPQQQAAAQPPAAAPQGRRQPQAKTQEEFKAYQEAAAKPDAAAKEQAALAFLAKYPDSELRAFLLLDTMRAYQNMDNAEKTVEVGRKVLEVDANNPEALVTVATVLSERTRETDLDRDERLAEASKDANLALEKVATELFVPPTLPPDRAETIKNVLRSMAYSALGTVEMTRKNLPAAETNLRKSTELNSVQPDPVTYLRLSVVLDQQRKYPAALEAANKAVQYAPEGSQASNLAKMERDRLMKLVAAPAPTTPAPTAPPPSAPQPTNPPPPGH